MSGNAVRLDPARNCVKLDATNNSVKMGCGAAGCDLNCAARVACSSYTLTFHFKLEKWNAVDLPDGDFTTPGPNPHSCVGPLAEEPADSVCEEDISTTLDVPDGICRRLSDTTSVYGTCGGLIDQSTLEATCDEDVIGIPMNIGFPGDVLIASRPRQSTVEGAYPGDSFCWTGDGLDDVYRFSISSVMIACADAGRQATAAVALAGSEPPPDLWTLRGPKLWTQFHAYLVAWDGDVAALAKWLARFSARLGCSGCKGHWIKLLIDNPPDTASPEALVAWGIARHNDVNQRLGKPIWKPKG